MAGYKLPSDAMVVANQKENTTIQDFQAQSADPITTIKEATRQSLFASKQTEVTERIAEVISVRSDIKLPAELNYFGEQQISEEYKQQKWYCAICRILDLHGVTPDPDIIVDASSGLNSFKDMTRMRLNIGKFYCPVEALASKGRKAVNVGDWLVVEFQDKTLMTNGIIKDVYIAPVLAREDTANGGDTSASQAFAGGNSSLPLLTSAPPDAKFINPLGDIAPALSSDYTAFRESTGKSHFAIDLVNPSTNAPGVTPIYAVGSGKVFSTNTNVDSNGNSILIDHEGRGYSNYLHLHEPTAFNRGDTIQAGQFLGMMGNTGNVQKSDKGTGVHLHLVIYDKNFKEIDPKTVIDWAVWTPPNAPLVYEESSTTTEQPNLGQSDTTEQAQNTVQFPASENTSTI